jgi:hypothetical protein
MQITGRGLGEDEGHAQEEASLEKPGFRKINLK